MGIFNKSRNGSSSKDTLGQALKKTVSGLAVGATVSAAAVSIPSLANAASLQPSTATYNFTIEDKYKGTATRKLSKSGNSWTYDVNARVAGVATANQHATFSLSGNNVIPSKASTTYKIMGIGRTHNLSYNAASKKVTSTYKGETKTMNMPAQAYDDLTLEAQIRQELLNGRFSGSYYMAKKDKVEKTPFKKSGSSKITVPAGTFDTIRVDCIHDDSSRSTSFWLAPSLNYMPVKVTQNNDGKKMDLELTKVN